MPIPVHRPAMRRLLDQLRVLAGGRGWLVEEAIRHTASGREAARLGDVVPCLLERRIELEGDPAGLLAHLRARWTGAAEGRCGPGADEADGGGAETRRREGP